MYVQLLALKGFYVKSLQNLKQLFRNNLFLFYLIMQEAMKLMVSIEDL